MKISVNPPPFSYLLSENKIDLDPKSEIRNLALPCGRFFYKHESLETCVAHDAESGAYVLVAGLAIDLVRNTLLLTDVAKSLLDCLLLSERDFLDRIDLVSGRYVVVYRRSFCSSPFVLGDATNMLKINYAKDEKICSSNIFLIDLVIHGGQRSWRTIFKEKRGLWTAGVLGDLSPINGIKILTPNHRLDLSSYEIDRFYPRERILENPNVDLVSDIVYELCRKQQMLLSERYHLQYSLTAGIDSRFSLSIAGLRKETQTFFTYLLGEGDSVIDAKVADRIATTLGLQHKLLIREGVNFSDLLSDISSPVFLTSHNQDLAKNLKYWDWYGHLSRNVHAYKSVLVEQSGGAEVLHIRSNLYEIGRAFWGKRHGMCDDPKFILQKCRKDWMRECPDIFDSYFEKNEINSASVFGLDLLDIFYWEHRCGTWVSEVLQGTDFAFNTHAYVNCRKILEHMLSLSFENRVDAALFKTIISEHLPEIEHIPVNPAVF